MRGSYYDDCHGNNYDPRYDDIIRMLEENNRKDKHQSSDIRELYEAMSELKDVIINKHHHDCENHHHDDHKHHRPNHHHDHCHDDLYRDLLEVTRDVAEELKRLEHHDCECNHDNHHGHHDHKPGKPDVDVPGCDCDDECDCDCDEVDILPEQLIYDVLSRL